MTWPLPLTVIEKLLIAEDRPGYSWSVFFRLRFSKRLNEAAVRAAVLAVLPRHPLLCSLVRRTFLGGGQWIEAENKTPLFESVPRVDGREYPPAKHLDLTKEIGIRVILVSDDHSSDVIFQIHHAVLDGKGMMGFVQDWLIAYAREIGVAPTDLDFTPLDESLLPKRGRMGLTFGRVLGMIRRRQLVGLKGVKQFLANKPTPLLPHIARPSKELANNQFPAVRLNYFTVDETLGTIRAAKKRGVSVNDLLIRDLLSAIFSLQKNHGVYVEDNVIRMMIPMNMPPRRRTDVSRQCGEFNLHRPLRPARRRLRPFVAIDPRRNAGHQKERTWFHVYFFAQAWRWAPRPHCRNGARRKMPGLFHPHERGAGVRRRPATSRPRPDCRRGCDSRAF